MTTRSLSARNLSAPKRIVLIGAVGGAAAVLGLTAGRALDVARRLGERKPRSAARLGIARAA